MFPYEIRFTLINGLIWNNPWITTREQDVVSDVVTGTCVIDYVNEMNAKLEGGYKIRNAKLVRVEDESTVIEHVVM